MPGNHVAHDEAARRHIQHRQACIDARHHALRRQRIRAAVPQAWFSLPGGVLHHHPQPLCTDRKVHRAADLLHRFIGRARPVGDVAILGHLECAEHAKIQMPAARDGKTVGVMHIAAAGAQRHMRRAGIDQERIDLVRRRRGPDADHAVLGMEDHLAIDRHEVGDVRRNADAEIDQPAFGNIACRTLGNAVAIERGKFKVRHALFLQGHVQHAIDEDARRHHALRRQSRPVRRHCASSRWSAWRPSPSPD